MYLISYFSAVPLNTGMDFFLRNGVLFYEMEHFNPFLQLFFCFHDFYHIWL